LGYLPLYTAAPPARVAVIGQAPGRQAQESGRPWNDETGVKLRSWLGVTAEQFYDPARVAILPMDFFYPGRGTNGHLPPRKEFAPKWHPRVFLELRQVRLTILVGSHAQKYYLGASAKPNLTETVRCYRQYLPGMLPLVHPSPLDFRWQQRNPWFEQEV